MKHKISISINAETLQKVQNRITEGRFRNTSHAFEYAFQQLDSEQDSKVSDHE